MKNQFELEQQIHQCWSITDDLALVNKLVLEGTPSQDEVSNLLAGLQAIYELKFQTLFSTFEASLK